MGGGFFSIERGIVTFNRFSEPVEYERYAKKKKKKELNWGVLSKHTFLAFMHLLKNHDHRYYHSNNNSHYQANKKIAQRVEQITKNPDFKRIYDYWENDNHRALEQVRLSFI